MDWLDINIVKNFCQHNFVKFDSNFFVCYDNGTEQISEKKVNYMKNITLQGSGNIQFTAAVTKPAYELVYEQLKELILNGSLKPGDYLPSERELMKLYERSHPTIREALRMLEISGYVAVIHGEGAKVLHTSTDSIQEPLHELLKFNHVSLEEIMEFATVAEPMFIRNAIEKQTENDKQELINCISSMEMALNDSEKFTIAFMNLHEILMNSTHNPLLLIIWTSIFQYLKEQNTKHDNEIIPVKNKVLLYSISKDVVNSFINRDTDSSSRLLHQLWKECHFDVSDSITIKKSTILENKTRPELVFRPIPKQKASVSIYEQIRSKIISGELQAGDKLPSERELIEIFQRSRPTIREALRMLEMKNYVTISQGKGITVNKLDTKEIAQLINELISFDLLKPEDIYEVRSVTDSMAVTWACIRRTETDILHINEILSMAKENQGYNAVYLDLGTKLHNAIARSSGNQILYIISRMTAEFSHDSYISYLEQKEHDNYGDILNTIYEEHRLLVEAIEKQDTLLADKAIESHLKNAYTMLQN